MSISSLGAAIHIIDQNFNDFDTANQGGGESDDIIGTNDLEAVADNKGGRFSYEERQAAQFLLNSKASLSFLDVAASSGKVDGKIGRGDINAAKETFDSGSYYDELLDTAAGRGKRDSCVSNDDIAAALSDPGVPQELKDVLNLFQLTPNPSFSTDPARLR